MRKSPHISCRNVILDKEINCAFFFNELSTPAEPPIIKVSSPSLVLMNDANSSELNCFPPLSRIKVLPPTYLLSFSASFDIPSPLSSSASSLQNGWRRFLYSSIPSCIYLSLILPIDIILIFWIITREVQYDYKFFLNYLKTSQSNLFVILKW